MAEHLLIADVASLLLVLGLTGPVLAPLLRVRGADRVRALAHPVPAFAIRALNLWLWHLTVAYQGALRHDLVHFIQHACFLLAGMNLWMPLFGPFPKPSWFGLPAQLVYVVAVRLTGAVLANLFLWSGTVFYGWYGDLGDQSAAGAVMMVEESLVTVALFGWLFMKWMREGAERQELEELAAAPVLPSTRNGSRAQSQPAAAAAPTQTALSAAGRSLISTSEPVGQWNDEGATGAATRVRLPS